MSNSFITMQKIADMALPLLMDNIAFLPLITTGKYDSQFSAKKGDTIKVVRPARVTAIDGDQDISSLYEDFAETSVPITLDNIATVARAWTSKEATLNMDDLQGTTPDELADIAQSRKILQDNRAPRDGRAFVMDNTAEAEFLVLDSLVEVDKSGTNSALRDAALGRVMGMMLAADNQVPTHTAGAFTALTDLTSDGIQAIDATTFNVESAAGTSTAAVVEGDIFTIETGDAAGTYVCTAAATAASGDIALTIDPPLRGATADTDTVAFADETAGAHVANLMFQKEAFTMASAPLEGAIGGANSAQASAHGLTITVTQDYDINTNTNLIRFDYLFGVQATMPDLAVRVLG